MKKITKAFLIILLSLVMSLTSIPAFASDAQSDANAGITPYLEHMSNAKFIFSATESGGHVNVEYVGYEDSFVRADITVKVQKRFLWVFWNDIDEWSISSTDINGDFYHVFTLNGSGTYRATMTLNVIGTDGTVDTITDTLESKY